jgi:hypothetical protein
MRNYKLKPFQKWTKKAKIDDSVLSNALSDLDLNKSAVQLGENLFKIRVSRMSQGKSGGYRTIVVLKKGVRSIFLYGFSKNERSNISKVELEGFKNLAKFYSSVTEDTIQALVETGALVELEENKK